MPRSINNADQQFLSRLNRLGDCTIQNLCDDLGVTATAVRQRLKRLLTLGCIERDQVRGDRGRPYYVYRVTSLGLRELGNDYRELALLLWRELSHIEESDVRGRLMSRLRSALVTRFGPKSVDRPLLERFRSLGQSLDEQGFQVDVDERNHGATTLPVLRAYSCPYHELAAEDSSICDLEQSVFEAVLGVPVTLSQCCRNGASCCEFEPVLA